MISQKHQDSRNPHDIIINSWLFIFCFICMHDNNLLNGIYHISFVYTYILELLYPYWFLKIIILLLLFVIICYNCFFFSSKIIQEIGNLISLRELIRFIERIYYIDAHQILDDKAGPRQKESWIWRRADECREWDFSFVESLPGLL